MTKLIPAPSPSRRSLLIGAAGVGAALAAPALISGSAAAAAPKAVTLLNVSYDPTRELYKDINAAFARFKELADRKSDIFDEDILALVSEENTHQGDDAYGFVSLAQHSETGERPQAKVVFTVHGKEVHGQSDGNGPVDASLKAIENHVKSGAEMVLYSVNAISGSTESQGEVTVRLQNSGRVVNGVGSDPDIVVASAKAYLSALNKLQSKADRVAAQG